MRFADMLASFVVYCHALGTLGRRTIENYCRDLELFQRRFPGDPRDWTRDHIRLFLGNARWSAATKLIRFKSLDAFFRFTVTEGLLPDSPMDGVDRPRGAKTARRPDVLAERDMDLLLMVWPEWTWMGLRNRAILWSFFTMPFRLSELAYLQVDDLSLREFAVRARRSKGNDEGYTATVFPKAAVAIDRYRRRLPEEWRVAPYLWVAQDGSSMTPHAIQQMLRRTEKRAHEAGFRKHFWPHAYRHNWGIKTVQWGLALDISARSMGQKTTAAAEIYRQWAVDQEAQIQIRRIAGVGA